MRGTIIVQQPTAKIPPEVTQYSKDWPLPNRDYGNTRFTTDAIIDSSNVGNLTLAWSFKITGIGAYGGGASNPIIMGHNVYFQDLRANVFSLNLKNGHVNWEKIYNISAVVGPNGPAVGWGKVFVAKDLYTIAALNARAPFGVLKESYGELTEDDLLAKFGIDLNRLFLNSGIHWEHRSHAH